jgi:asparagine synthase (glutamine-hydrolysing)
MCGLTALLALNGGPECLQCDNNHDPQALQRQMDESLELVKHRGPDARGQWFSSDYSVGQ